MQRSLSMKGDHNDWLAPPPDASTMPKPSLSTSNLAMASFSPSQPQLATSSSLGASRASSRTLAPAINSPLAPTTIILRVLITAMSITKTLRASSSDTVWALKKQVIEKMNTDVKGALNYGIYLPPPPPLPTATGKPAKGRFLEDQRTLESCGLENNAQIEFAIRKRVHATPPSDADALPTLKNQKKFMEDISKGNHDRVRERCTKGFDPNFETEAGDTPLCVAAMQDDPEMLAILMDSGGASLDYRCSDALHGKSPFHLAVANNKTVAVRYMIFRSAWVDIPDALGLTPLYYAVLGGHPECVDRLLELKADTSYVDESGKTLLHTACLNNFGQVTGLLIDFGGLDIDAVNVAGNTPLHLTGTRNAVESARRLLIRGADREKTNKFGNTALQMAVLSGSTEVVELLKSFRDDQIIPPPPPYTPENSPLVKRRIHRSANSFDVTDQSTTSHSAESPVRLSGLSAPQRQRSQSASKESILASPTPVSPTVPVTSPSAVSPTTAPDVNAVHVKATRKIPGPPAKPPPASFLQESTASTSPMQVDTTMAAAAVPLSESGASGQQAIQQSQTAVSPDGSNPSILPDQQVAITASSSATPNKSLNRRGATSPMHHNSTSNMASVPVTPVHKLRERTLTTGRPASSVEVSMSMKHTALSTSITCAGGNGGDANGAASARMASRHTSDQYLNSGSNSAGGGETVSDAKNANAAINPSLRLSIEKDVSVASCSESVRTDVEAMASAIGKLKELVFDGGLFDAAPRHGKLILQELESIGTRCKQLEVDLEEAVHKLVRDVPADM
ncbi:SH3 and multiple ankyrin repeat domains protein 2 [Chytriomyces hyalinus]|nr:SH3 and multiple ankyrin repeat domains protein 2 [Chytriomyces hyalinus]